MQSRVVCGLFLPYEDWGEGLTTHYPPALFFFFSPPIFQVEISLCTPNPFLFWFLLFVCLLLPESVQSGSASSDDCGRVFLGELRVSSSSVIGFHTVPGQHSQPTPTSLGQGCMRV